MHHFNKLWRSWPLLLSYTLIAGSVILSVFCKISFIAVGLLLTFYLGVTSIRLRDVLYRHTAQTMITLVSFCLFLVVKFLYALGAVKLDRVTEFIEKAAFLGFSASSLALVYFFGSSVALAAGFWIRRSFARSHGQGLVALYMLFSWASFGVLSAEFALGFVFSCFIIAGFILCLDRKEGVRIFFTLLVPLAMILPIASFLGTSSASTRQFALAFTGFGLGCLMTGFLLGVIFLYLRSQNGRNQVTAASLVHKKVS